MINAKTPDLVGVNEGVIQFRAVVKRFIDDQNASLASNWFIPGSGAGHDWHIRKGFD